MFMFNKQACGAFLERREPLLKEMFAIAWA